MKRKKTKVIVPIKSATVSNAINLNLTQNDLIDLVIQEQLEKLETVVEEVQKKLDAVEESRKVILTELEKEAIAIVKRGNIFKVLKQTIEQNHEKIHIKCLVALDYITNYSIQVNHIRGHYNYRELTSINFKNACSQKYLHTTTIKSTVGEMYSDSPQRDIFCSVKVQLPPDVINQAVVKLNNLSLEEMDLYAHLYKVQETYINFKCGEKRVKSRMVKATLQSSKEGKDILAMVKSISLATMLK